MHFRRTKHSVVDVPTYDPKKAASYNSVNNAYKRWLAERIAANKLTAVTTTRHGKHI